jgi:Tfp pilus assembly protein PilO
MRKFDIRQAGRPILTVLAVWLVLNIAFMLFLVRPKVREYANLERDSQPRIEALRERQAEVEGSEAFLSALQQAEADLSELRSGVLGTRGRQMVPIQLELDRLARQFSIDPDRIQYQNSNLIDEGLERFAMVVPLEAAYGNLRRFMQAVETSSKFLVIEKVSLGQSKEGGVILQLNITLATYFDAPHLKERDSEGRRRRGAQRTAGRT